MKQDLEAFIKLGDRNRWIVGNGYAIYVRQNRYLDRFDIASVEVYPRGVGTFTRTILPEVIHAARSAHYGSLYVENVLNEWFAMYFRRQGWIEIDHGGIPSFRLVL